MNTHKRNRFLEVKRFSTLCGKINTYKRNRFLEVKRFIQLTDNMPLDTFDKMAKLRPHVDRLNQNFKQWEFFIKIYV